MNEEMYINRLGKKSVEKEKSKVKTKKTGGKSWRKTENHQVGQKKQGTNKWKEGGDKVWKKRWEKKKM